MEEWNERRTRKIRSQSLSHFFKVWPDKSYYEGEWIEDKAWGKGKLVHIDGDIYEGDWVDDTANGYGEYIHSGFKFQIPIFIQEGPNTRASGRTTCSTAKALKNGQMAPSTKVSMSLAKNKEKVS